MQASTPPPANTHTHTYSHLINQSFFISTRSLSSLIHSLIHLHAHTHNTHMHILTHTLHIIQSHTLLKITHTYSLTLKNPLTYLETVTKIWSSKKEQSTNTIQK